MRLALVHVVRSMQTHTFTRSNISFACLYRAGSSVELFLDAPSASSDLAQYTMSLPAFRQFTAALSLAADKMAEEERAHNAKNVTPDNDKK